MNTFTFQIVCEYNMGKLNPLLGTKSGLFKRYSDIEVSKNNIRFHLQGKEPFRSRIEINKLEDKETSFVATGSVEVDNYKWLSVIGGVFMIGFAYSLIPDVGVISLWGSLLIIPLTYQTLFYEWRQKRWVKKKIERLASTINGEIISVTLVGDKKDKIVVVK